MLLLGLVLKVGSLASSFLKLKKILGGSQDLENLLDFIKMRILMFAKMSKINRMTKFHL